MTYLYKERNKVGKKLLDRTQKERGKFKKDGNKSGLMEKKEQTNNGQTRRVDFLRRNKLGNFQARRGLKGHRRGVAKVED